MVKRYVLNNDFAIDCETIDNGGIKIYNMYVIQISVPFLNILEESKGIIDSNIANKEFKRLSSKYRTPLFSL